jgi:hypothetical protein
MGSTENVMCVERVADTCGSPTIAIESDKAVFKKKVLAKRKRKIGSRGEMESREEGVGISILREQRYIITSPMNKGSMVGRPGTNRKIGQKSG